MRGLPAAIVGLLIIGSVLTISRAKAETSIALVIGNSVYQAMPRLPSPINDARALAQALAATGFRVTLLQNGTKAQIERSLSELTHQLRSGTTSFVYYAGYALNLSGRNYLLPVDAEVTTPGSLRLQAVDVDETIGQIGRTQARSIIILDACRANPFVGKDEPVSDLTKVDREPAIDPGFRSLSSGLASITAPANILIAFPTTPGMIASDGGGEHGLYATELIKALGIPGASVETVFKETRRGVIAQSEGTQIPWESSSLTSDIFFSPVGVLLSTTPPPWVPLPTVVVPRLPPPSEITARVQQVAKQEGIGEPPSLEFYGATTPPEYRMLLGPWGPAAWNAGPRGIQNRIILIFLGINSVGNGHVVYCSSPHGYGATCGEEIARVINGKIMFSTTLKDGTQVSHEYELGNDGKLHGVRGGNDIIVLPPLR
jgi:Caspase domain